MPYVTKIKRAAVLSLLLVLATCNESMDMNANARNDIRLSDWEVRMKVRFPENTEALGLREEPGRDDMVYLKVRMPKQAWAGFLEKSSVHPDDLDNAKRFFLGQDRDWWDPGKPAELPTAQASLPDGSVLNLGVDLSGATEATVYLRWHER